MSLLPIDVMTSTLSRMDFELTSRRHVTSPIVTEDAMIARFFKKFTDFTQTFSKFILRPRRYQKDILHRHLYEGNTQNSEVSFWYLRGLTVKFQLFAVFLYKNPHEK